MLKRLGISFCFLLAFALLQAHNFVEHHHGDVLPDHHHHAGQDHHDHEHHDSNQQDNSTENNQTHSSDFGKILIKPNSEEKILLAPVSTLSNTIFAYDELVDSYYHSPPRPPDKNCFVHIIFYSHSLPFRAPPASSCLS
jgi:hypothetical protein